MHAHVSIRYKDIETLDGFDPRHDEGYTYAHALLDEYLAVLCESMNEAERLGKNEARIDEGASLNLIDPDNHGKEWPEFTESCGGLFFSPFFHE
jgi:hypothetical protein